MPVLSKVELSRLMPHGGDMCLLHSIEGWDTALIRCAACSHRDRTNPLRHDSRLHAICGLEYAAQAMALHVALLAPTHSRPTVGYLGAVRDLTMHAQRLDDVADDLEIEATRMIGEETHFIYSFLVAAGGVPLLSGRASIFVRWDRDS